MLSRRAFQTRTIIRCAGVICAFFIFTPQGYAGVKEKVAALKNRALASSTPAS